MIITLKTAPLKQPLTLAEAKEHLRIELSDVTEDDLVLSLIKAACKRAEDFLGRRLITQTYYYYLKQWPKGDYIILPYGKLQAGAIITYTDSNEAPYTFSSTLYYTDTDSEPGRIVLRYGESWPTDTLDSKNPIRVEFICGYGTDPNDVPATIRTGIKYLIGHWHSNREPFLVGTVVAEVDQTFTDILSTEKLYWTYD